MPEPEVWLVDGNGLLHPRRCGLACHFGVVANVRTVGVGKNFLHVDGVTKDGVAAAVAKHLLPSVPAVQAASIASSVSESDAATTSVDASPSVSRSCLRADETNPEVEARVTMAEGEPFPLEAGDISKDAIVIRSLKDGRALCSALLSGKSGSRRPIFVSVGHRVSL